MLDLTSAPPAPGESDLDLLVAIATTGALDRAARVLGLTRAAVDRRLSAVQQGMGVRLVAGRPGSLTLTHAGTRLVAAGRRLRSAAADAARDLARGAPSPADAGAGVPEAPATPGRLRVAATCGPWLTIAEELAARDRGLLLDVVPAAAGTGAALLAAGQVDVAYEWWPDGAGDAGDRHVHQVVDEPLWIALPVDHPQAGRDRVALRDLTAERWVVRTDPASEALTRAVHARLGIRAGLLPVRSAALGRGLVARGDAVGLTSPLTRPVVPGSNVVRPTVEAPVRRFVLAAAPAADAGWVRLLLRGLARHYAALAAARNPRYHAGLRLRVPPGAAGDVDVGLDDVLLLQTVSRCGSLNRAAPRLLLSQPAASRRIQRLERRLGVPLLARTNRGAVLTADGERLLRAVAGPDAEYRAVVAAVRAAGARRGPDRGSSGRAQIQQPT
jgi:DNA-binding transcriptional LysR family regulator